MKRGVVITAVSFFFAAGLMVSGYAVAADPPPAGAPAAKPAPTGPADMVTGKPGVYKGEVLKTLKGRVWAQWADNPEHEILFGIQYWNTGAPASGTPNGRASSDMDVRVPDPLVVCCAWGFVGGTEKNNPYAGWYTSAQTVRLLVKDKATMDSLIKTSQDLVALEVNLDGRTITGFKVLK